VSQLGFIRDWLGDREDEFRRRLQGISLAIEADIDENLMVSAAEFFGVHVGKLHRIHGWSGREITRKYPALTLVTLVGHAATDYEQNRYWDSYWEKLDIPREQALEHDFRRAVPELLEKFGLARFPKLEGKYVQQLAMHAGIPNYCLRGVVEAIGTHLAFGREPTGSALIDWLSDPAKPHRLNVLNVPARNFIRDGGEFAVDVFDRILELVLFVADNSPSWADSLEAGEITTETAGLPGIMLDGLLDILEERGGVDLPPRAHAARKRSGGTPYLVLDTMEDTVMVCLPHPGENLSPVWSVSLDGDVTEVEGAVGWGTPEHQPPAKMAITRPVMSVAVTQSEAGRTHTLPLVETADPMVLFANSGHLIGRRDPVPLGTVYALFPKGHELSDGGTGEILEPEIDLGVPSGWLNWRLVTVSTVDLRSLQLVDETRAKVGGARVVRNSFLPELKLDTPIAGVASVNGALVYATRPEVWLPRHPAGRSIRWQVGVRRIGEGGWVAQQSWELDNEDVSVDPFGDVPDGLLGAFEILVRGPLGSDLRRTVMIAEGLAVEADTPFRYPEGSGLSPSNVVLSREGPLELGVTGLAFDAQTRQRVVTVSSGDVHEHLVVSPPHLDFRLDPVGQRPTWSALPHVATPADFTANRVVAVRVPVDKATVSIELIDAEGEVRQAEEPSYRVTADAFEVRTVRFTDTVRSLGAGQILVTVETPGRPAVAVPAVHIRPAQLCGSMALVDGVVRFTDLAPVSGLSLQIWRESAPWRRPVALPVTGNELALPQDLRDVGPLLASMTVHDGWTSVPLSSTPHLDATRLVQLGWTPDRDHALDHLSRFLVGIPCEPDRAAGRAEVWSAVAAQRSTDTEDSVRIRGGLSELLLRDPRASLEALATSAVPVEIQAELLVRSGLLLREFGAYGVWDEISAHPWVACMTALADLPDLRFGSQLRELTIAAARRQGGEALLHLAGTGQDRHAASGLFDKSSVAMSVLPSLRVEQIFELASIVPSALAERDTRITAIAEAFKERRRWARTAACHELPERLGPRARIVERISPDLHSSIAVRNEALDGVKTIDHPWITLPLMSMSIAMLVRLQAHQVIGNNVVDTDLIEGWAEMAHVCPKLVLSDLLIAEALVVHHKYGNILGELDV